MARARNLIKLTQDRQKVADEIYLLRKRIELKEHEITVLDGEINHEATYSQSPKAKQLAKTLVKKKTS